MLFLIGREKQFQTAWIMFCVLATIGAMGFFFGFQSSNTKEMSEEAKRLLADGVNDANQDKAIELLLSHAFKDYSRTTGVDSLPRWFWWTLIAVFVVAVVLSLGPSDVIGIGKGRFSIRFWNGVYAKAKWIFLVLVVSGILFRWIGSEVIDYIKRLFQ